MINENWKTLFPEHILERGRDYAYEGAVEDIRMEAGMIKAVVIGSREYRVKIALKDGEVQRMYCSCPYAHQESYCKHMAAVLFEVEDEAEDTEDTEDEECYSVLGELSKRQEATDIGELLESVTKEDLIAFVRDLAYGNNEMTNLLRVRFSHHISSADMRELKRESYKIFRSHEGGGFISYHEAPDFVEDICRFLDERVGKLVDNKQYMEAFELSMYIFIELSEIDIDDDGELETVFSSCYDLWKRIVNSCSMEEREKIKNWFDEHADDGTVVDYMEDILQEFRDRELATDDELREQMKDLDEKIDAAGNSTQCPIIWSLISCRIPAVIARIELMERLGMDEREIEAYRNEHRHFRAVREQYIEEAEKAGDRESLISLLEESKQLDAGEPNTVHKHAQKLADLYHDAGDIQKEIEERLGNYLRGPGSGIDAFRTIKSLCGQEEWPAYRDKMITATTDPDKRCELFAEEKMVDELYSLVFKKPDLKYIDKYGLFLADDHAEEILDFYSRYVQSKAEQARSSSSYAELTHYLSRMQQYKGGPELVRKLAAKWTRDYRTRKLMVTELRRFL